MEWTPDAQEAIRKVPFFVRKRVRARVEKEAEADGKQVVTLAEVRATQARYLSRMEIDIRGYQVETCFGSGGCPNHAIVSDGLVARIQSLMAEQHLLEFLKQQVPEGLKYHHEFRIAVADCPNACSQPQIRDIGIIGACTPAVTPEPCSTCQACVDICKEAAIQLEAESPVIGASCVRCGQCIPVCPTGTLFKGKPGYRILLGGKLGRHPHLAAELPGVYDEDAVIAILRDCVALYKTHSRHGERFAGIIQSLTQNNPSFLADALHLSEYHAPF